MKHVYQINFKSSRVQSIGFLSPLMAQKANIICNSYEINISPGAIKHIKKRHPDIIENYGEFIPIIISKPHYIGCHPKIPNSIELVHKIDQYLLVAIKSDSSGYLFLSSFYTLNNGHFKVMERTRTGRLIPFYEL